MVDESFWEPLPPLQDLISGNFKRSEKRKERENASESEKEESFKSFNKIKNETEVEDGEISEQEEGEIDEDEVEELKPAKKPRTDSNREAKSLKDVKRESKPNQNNSKHKQPEKQQPFVPRIVCRYFMDGVCSKGDKCTFSHAVVPNRTAEEARVKDACKFFIAGSCMKGSACHFSHELSKFPCKFFHLKGECAAALKGCRFSHAPISPEELEKLRVAETERINEKERAIQTLNSLKSSLSSASSFDSASSASTTEARKQPEKTATKDDQMTMHASLVNPFADVDDL